MGQRGGANEHKCFLTLRRAKRLRRDERGKGQRVGSHSLQANGGTMKQTSDNSGIPTEKEQLATHFRDTPLSREAIILKL